MASAQALWGGVAAGSSPAQVRERFADAQPAAPGDGVPVPGALLQIPRVDIAGGAFTVHFLFERERLHRVVLRAQTDSAEAADALAQRVYRSLRARYGLEQSSRSRGSTISRTLDRRWLFRRTTVHLQVVDGHGVELTYGVEAPRQTDAL